MEYGFQEICINPLKPVKQAGFIEQVNEVFTFHDDLNARLLGLQDDKKVVYLFSLDNLGVSDGLKLQESLEEACRKFTSKQVIVEVSSTHDHFAGYAGDKSYYKQLYKQLLQAIKDLTWIKSRLFISHKHVFYDKVGKSRISNHNANVFLDVFEIFNKEKRAGSLIIYNCHPTILNGSTPYFTSEYPGYVLSKLKEKYPNEFFTFYNGAAGDISTRFTRCCQTYDSVVELGNKLVSKIEELLNSSSKKAEIENMRYEKHIFELEHDLKPIDISKLPTNISERELETIKVGAKIREEKLKNKKNIQNEILLTKLVMGGYNFIFSPKETFSSYLNALDLDKSVLICYTNGYSPYIVDIGFKGITYEMFTDTTTEETKQRFYKLLNELGK